MITMDDYFEIACDLLDNGFDAREMALAFLNYMSSDQQAQFMQWLCADYEIELDVLGGDSD